MLVGSWRDWQNVLNFGRIFDEYSHEISYDDFVAKVESSKGKQNHYDYLRDSPQYGAAFLKDEYKDAEGWDFSRGVFS